MEELEIEQKEKVAKVINRISELTEFLNQKRKELDCDNFDEGRSDNNEDSEIDTVG